MAMQQSVANDDDITREVKAKIEAKFQETDVVLTFNKFIEQKDTLINENIEFRQENRGVRDEIRVVKDENRNVKDEIRVVKDENRVVKDEIRNVNNDKRDLEEENMILRDRKTALEEENRRLQQRIAQLEGVPLS